MTGRSCVAVLIACVTLRSVGAQSQPPTFSSVATGVRLDVKVIDGASAVHGLAPENFQVFDNGVRQQFSLTETKDAPLDVMIVAPPVSSLSEDRRSLIRRCTEALGHLLRPVDRVAIVVATPPPSVIRLLTAADDQPLMIPASLEGYGVALRDAMVQAFLLSDQADRRKAMIVFTDGRADQSWVTEAAIRESADRQPAQLIVAGLAVQLSRIAHSAWNDGRSAGEESTVLLGSPDLALPPWLLEASKRTGGRAIDLRASRAADQIAALITDLRSQYVITYTPSGVSTTSPWHEVEVVLKGRKGTVLTRAGYSSNR